jgi:hypothetical protein
MKVSLPNLTLVNGPVSNGSKSLLAYGSRTHSAMPRAALCVVGKFARYGIQADLQPYGQTSPR